MDLLFKRYASPFLLLDGYIQTGRFCELIQTLCEQKIEEDRWEYFLHKVWDKSYTDFCEELSTVQAAQDMTDDKMEATVQTSLEILNNFKVPPKEGEN